MDKDKELYLPGLGQLDRDRLKKDAEYRTEVLREAFGLSVTGLQIAALAIHDMDEADQEIPSFVPTSLLKGLRRVALQHMLPELLMQVGRKNILLANRIGFYSLAEQRLVVDDTPIPVVVLKPDGKGFDHRKLPLSSLEPEQAKQVFGSDGIRDERAQIAYIENRRTNGHIRKGKDANEIRVDKKHNRILVKGEHELTLPMLLGWVQELT